MNNSVKFLAVYHKSFHYSTPYIYDFNSVYKLQINTDSKFHD